MKKVLETGIEVVFAGLLAGCLFYCMVAGAGTTAYVILAAILSIAISVTLCAGFHYIRKLKKQLEELELAYAITIHKSQGSEYPAVIIPMYSGPRMLMTRNLIYTAVTRARSCVCLVGRPDAFYTMADNSMEQKRYCGLKTRIEEIYA